MAINTTALISAVYELNEMYVQIENGNMENFDELPVHLKALAAKAGCTAEELIYFHAFAAADTPGEAIEGLILGQTLFDRFKDTGEIDGAIYQRLQELSNKHGIMN